MLVNGTPYRSVWLDGSIVKLIDQRLLPHQFAILDCPTYQETADAIRSMAVRGAGAIGVAAGFAIAQAALKAPEATLQQEVGRAATLTRATRPTARDLFYAVDQIARTIHHAHTPAEARRAAVETAHRLADENAQAGEAIGVAGEPLVPPHARVLTHCNAGWLAFADWGSALAPIYRAHRLGKQPLVYATETRPRGQGAKLTAWELGQEGVAYTLIADTAAGWLFQHGELDCVIVGADRIAANGDTANKIGTYPLAVLAQRHGVPFYVAAPRSTFDDATPSGEAIPIEQRSEEELLWAVGRSESGITQRVRVSADSAHAKNPAFDVTPAALIRGFITDGGMIAPTQEAIAMLLHPTMARLP